MYGIGVSCSAANTAFFSGAAVVIAGSPPSRPHGRAAQSSPRGSRRPRGWGGYFGRGSPILTADGEREGDQRSRGAGGGDRGRPREPHRLARRARDADRDQRRHSGKRAAPGPVAEL